MDVVSARWEQLSIVELRPIAGYQFLWLKVKITNGLAQNLIIVPMTFGVVGDDGTRYNATDDDSQGTILPGSSATFNISVEVPWDFVPKTVKFSYGNDVFTENAPSPSAMVADVVFSNVTYTRNDTDSSGLNQTPFGFQVLHVSFFLENQWTKAIDTLIASFAIVDAGNNQIDAHLKNGTDSIIPGERSHFTIDFLVSASYIPKVIKYSMEPLSGPYGSVNNWYL